MSVIEWPEKLYFGDWSAPYTEQARRVPVPLGQACAWCRVVFVEGDAGPVIPAHTVNGTEAMPWHVECFMRSVLGSVAHQEGRCCTVHHDRGSDSPEEVRADAVAAWRWLLEKGKRDEWKRLNQVERMRLLVVGPRMSPVRAAEVLVRTTSLIGAVAGGVYDVDAVRAMGAGGLVDAGSDEEWLAEFERVSGELGSLALSVMGTNRIRVGAGGALGWVDWDGSVGSSWYGAGTGMVQEWLVADLELLAGAFGWLELTCQLVDDDRVVRSQWRVAQGQVWEAAPDRVPVLPVPFGLPGSDQRGRAPVDLGAVRAGARAARERGVR